MINIDRGVSNIKDALSDVQCSFACRDANSF